MAKLFTNDNFASEVIEASKSHPVLVDFYADWCGPCQVQGPIVEELAGEQEGKAIIGKLDTEASMDIAKQYGVMSIPTIIIFRNGEPAERLVGVQEKDVLIENLAKHA